MATNTVTITKSWNALGLQGAYAVEYENSTGVVLACTVNAGATNQAQEFEIQHAGLEVFVIVSDQPVHMFVNAPSTGSPILTETLAANTPYVWTNDGYQTNPFSADLTSIYFTNAGATNANIEGFAL